MPLDTWDKSRIKWYSDYSWPKVSLAPSQLEKPSEVKQVGGLKPFQHISQHGIDVFPKWACKKKTE